VPNKPHFSLLYMLIKL